MEVLAHCRIYPLSNFYKCSPLFVKLPNGLLTNIPTSKTDLNKLGFLHLVEYSFQLSPFKKKLFDINLTQISDTEGSVLIIDVLSIWKQHIETHQEHTRTKNIHYLNSNGIMTLERLLQFLKLLESDPLKALKECDIQGDVRKQLSGIIIDNISYYVHDTDNTVTYTAMLKALRKLRRTFGCWIMTVGYGIEYYDGVEHSTSNLYRGGTITRLPINYTSEMDAILLRSSESEARFTAN